MFKLDDGLVIETVIIPNGDRGRNTVCVSSQVGCAMNCQFCFTGRQVFLLMIFAKYSFFFVMGEQETSKLLDLQCLYKIIRNQSVFQDGSEEKSNYGRNSRTGGLRTAPIYQ